MNTFKLRRNVRYAFAGILLSITVTVSAVPLPVSAEVTEESIKAKEDQISSAKSERESLQNSLSDLQSIKESLEASKSDLETYVTELDSNLTAIQTKLDQLKQDISDKEEEISETEKELEEAEEVQQQQYEAMKKRIQFMYERGNTYMLEALLKAGSFGEMLNKAYYIDEVSAYDRKKLEEYQQQTKLVQTTKEALEEEKATLEEAKKAQEQEESNIQELMDEKAAEISSLSGQISDQEAQMEETQSAIDQSTSEIASLESQVAADKAALEAQKQAYSGGAFVWPAPSYTYISSEFGYRVHPIYGTTLFHSGLDMAAPYGSPILAAAAGTVVSAGYSSSMGNYVMINHGGGLFTIYMHASALYVSSGQSVSAGEQIAAVGSTGNSTGPHLHFSVRLNGQYVNPRNYL